jgi:DNA-binding IclR family transcriptional regulator
MRWRSEGDAAAAADSSVKSARRVIDIFEALAQRQNGMTLSDLARQLTIPKSSASGVVRTLLERGYLERTTTGHLTLGARLFDVGVCARADIRLQTVARPIMIQLMERTAESIFLGILTPDFEALFLDKVVSDQAIRYDADIGQTRPAHCSSLGKVLLAYLLEEQLGHYLRTKRRARFTPRTIVERQDLREELERIRKAGVALTVDERVLGVSAIAAPVRVGSGRPVAALVVAGPTERMVGRRAELVPRVKSAAARISEGLGVQAGADRGQIRAPGISGVILS